MVEENREKFLYIPTNIKTRIEFFEGYGLAEFSLTLIIIVISTIISMTIYNINHNTIFSVFIVLISTSITIAITIKDHNNQSILDFIIHLIQFCSEQKKYRYVYKEDFIDDFKKLLWKDF